MIKKAMSIYFNELVYELKRQNVDITTLSLGEAFFEIEKPNFDKYDVEELIHYTSSRGHPKLLQTLQKYYSTVHKADLDANEIMVTAGSKIAIYMTMLHCITSTKNKVAILEPAWLSYVEQVRLAAGEPVNFGLKTSSQQILDELTDEYCCVIINNPNNPRGNRYDEAELRKLFSECAKFNIKVIIDEAYSEFVPDALEFISSAKLIHEYNNIITVSSLSKNMGMSGFRIGYLVSNIDTVNAIVKYNQHLITCAPTILQVYIADKFFEIMEATTPQIATLINKREAVVEYCRSIGLNVLSGDSTFYLMVEIPSIDNVFDFSMHLLLDDYLSVVPGQAYGESCQNYVRVSIGTESVPRIKKAMEIIKFRIENGWNSNYSLQAKLSSHGLPFYN